MAVAVAALVLAIPIKTYARAGFLERAMQDASNGRCHWDYRTSGSIDADGKPCVATPPQSQSTETPTNQTQSDPAPKTIPPK